MVSVTGFFDGNICVPLVKKDLKRNQRVLITVIDNKKKEKSLKDIRGKISFADGYDYKKMRTER
jgi:hypothetical protein